MGKAAKQTVISFSGWVEFTFRLNTTSRGVQERIAPVFISNGAGVAEPPIIGYNIIKQFVKNGMEQYLEFTSAAIQEAFSLDCPKTDLYSAGREKC